MGQNISTRRWRILESSTPDEQKEFLSQEGFTFEPVSATTRNVKKGDHLMICRALGIYTHHLVCTKVKGNQIWAMEYGIRDHSEMSPKEALDILVDLEKLAEVHEQQFTFKQLEDKETQKKVWPKKLRRYKAKDVVKQAKSREGEKKYNCLTNNCESFVVWCICGLNVSLQVKIWFSWAKEAVKAICAGARNAVVREVSGQLGAFLLKVLANASDEIAVQMLGPQLESYSYAIGFLVGAIIESGLCLFQINKAFDDRESGEIKTDKELEVKIVEIIAKAAFRLAGGTAGSIVGLSFGILGSLVGGMVGAAVGNLIGGFLAKWYTTEQPEENTVKTRE